MFSVQLTHKFTRKILLEKIDQCFWGRADKTQIKIEALRRAITKQMF